MKRILVVLLSLLGVQAAHAHGISATDQQSMIGGGNFEFIKLGASHMLTGYDHLLFLFGVVFFLDKFRDITKFITAFTLGHSITLIFATFMGISANYYLIDAAIALTVAYKGFDNLGGFQKYLRMASPNLLALVFIFGLVHGFGLSTRLQQLPLGEGGLLLKILSFNLGVELGQIAALTVMLFLLRAWRGRPSFARFSTVSNVGLIVAGVLLFGYQISGYAGDRQGASEAVAATIWTDITNITIPAQGALEYKFHLEQGNPLQYAWQTDGTALFFDFHGDPVDAKPDEFESFEVATLNESSGTLTPPFAGAIGWYWQNKTDEPVKIVLKTQGEYEVIGVP
jgi:hypothetical protein